MSFGESSHQRKRIKMPKNDDVDCLVFSIVTGLLSTLITFAISLLFMLEWQRVIGTTILAGLTGLVIGFIFAPKVLK